MRTVFILTVALTLWLAPCVPACPTCADAVAAESNADEVDQAKLAAGYNRSIYLMLIVPYGALAFVSYLVVRQMRITEALQGRGTASNENDSETSTIPAGAR